MEERWFTSSLSMKYTDIIHDHGIDHAWNAHITYAAYTSCITLETPYTFHGDMLRTVNLQCGNI